VSLKAIGREGRHQPRGRMWISGWRYKAHLGPPDRALPTSRSRGLDRSSTSRLAAECIVGPSMAPVSQRFIDLLNVPQEVLRTIAERSRHRLLVDDVWALAEALDDLLAMSWKS